VDIAALVGDGSGGFGAALGSAWAPALPADHAAHSGCRSELWTLSGPLMDRAGRTCGFPLGLARIAPRPQPPERPSAWVANPIDRARFTLTSEGADRARVPERLCRGALGLAGTQREPPRAWVRDWFIGTGGSGRALDAGAQGGALTQDLEPVGSAIAGQDLDLFAGRRDGPGLSLCLLPRLRAGGHLVLDGETPDVEVTAMLDHAWGGIPAGGGRLAPNRFARSPARRRACAAVSGDQLPRRQRDTGPALRPDRRGRPGPVVSPPRDRTGAGGSLA